MKTKKNRLKKVNRKDVLLIRNLSRLPHRPFGKIMFSNLTAVKNQGLHT